MVLSTLEFDVLWESERLPRKHVALDVPSPGRTHSERARLVAGAMAGLRGRGLVEGDRAMPRGKAAGGGRPVRGAAHEAVE